MEFPFKNRDSSHRKSCTSTFKNLQKSMIIGDFQNQTSPSFASGYWFFCANIIRKISSFRVLVTNSEICSFRVVSIFVFQCRKLRLTVRALAQFEQYSWIIEFYRTKFDHSNTKYWRNLFKTKVSVILTLANLNNYNLH